jgi:hypothetical protein
MKPIKVFLASFLAAALLVSAPLLAQAFGGGGGGGDMSDDAIMDAVQTLDGAASQLDADLLDAISSAGFCQVTGGANCTMAGPVRIDEDTTCSTPQISGDARTTTGIAIGNAAASVIFCRLGSAVATVANEFTLNANMAVDSDDSRTLFGAALRPRRIITKFFNSTPTALDLGGGPTSTASPTAGVQTVTGSAAVAWTPGVTSISDGDLLTVCTADAGDNITLTEGATYLGTCTLTANTNSCASAVAIAGVWKQVSCSSN